MGTSGIVVALVAFDSQTEAVLKTAKSLARTFKLGIRLVYAIEPVTEEPLAADPALAGDYRMLINQYVAASRIRAEGLMAQLVAARRDDLPMAGVVRMGQAADAAIAECLTSRANLVVTGCNAGGSKQDTSGVSTALSLMQRAPLPVLVVQNGAVPEFGKSGVRILLADDLREGTREAVRKAYELGARLPGAAIMHASVEGGVQRQWREAWHDLREWAVSAEETDALALKVCQQEDAARSQALAIRGLPFSLHAEDAGAKVERLMLAGRVDEQLATVVASFHPDLVVFGRHRPVHAHPVRPGRLPWRSMLAAHGAVLVVPPESELYGRQPFPGDVGHGV